jgi:hypothetical protein
MAVLWYFRLAGQERAYSGWFERKDAGNGHRGRFVGVYYLDDGHQDDGDFG